MIPVQNKDFTNPYMNITFIHPKVVWGDLFYNSIPIDIMNPKRGNIVLSDFIYNKFYESLIPEYPKPGQLLIIKKNTLQDYKQQHTVIKALLSFLHFFNKKVICFEFSVEYHENHTMGGQLFTSNIIFSNPQHLPYSCEDNYLEAPLIKKAYEEIWEVCHGQKPEGESEYKLCFPLNAINYFFVET